MTDVKSYMRRMLYSDNIDLTDDAGDALTNDSDSVSFQTQTATGAETLDFYIDFDGSKKYTMLDVNVTASESVTLAVVLRWRVLGADKEKFAYAMDLTGTQAVGGVSTAYPWTEMVPYGTKAWVEVTTGGAATVAVNVMGVSA